MTAPIAGQAAQLALPNPSTQPTGHEACGGQGAFQAHMQAGQPAPHEVSADASVQAAGQTQNVHCASQAQSASAVPAPKSLDEIAQMGDAFKRVDNLQQFLMDRMNAGGQAMSMQELLQAQIMAQKATHQIELTTKIVEHATSGAKTALQTQA